MIKIKKEILKKYNPILIEEFKKTFPIYFLGILANGLNIVFHFLLPYIIGQILDMLLQGDFSTDEIFSKVYQFMIVSILILVQRGLYRSLFYRTAQISITKLRKKVTHHLQYVKPEYYEKEDKGTFLAYITKELISIRRFLGTFFFQIGKLVLNPIVLLIMIAIRYHPSISIVLLIVILIITKYIFKLYGELKDKLEDGRKADIELFKTIEKNTSGFSLIKLYNEQKNQLNKFSQINENRCTADYNIGVVKNKIANGTNIMRSVTFCVSFALGLILVKNNIITVGKLTALITNVAFMEHEITSSISPAINAIAYFKQSTKRYNYFFALEPYKTDGKDLEVVNTIKLDNLSYSYDGINNVLEDINITIKKGENIGIIGQVGSGKTTLMNIISGFLEVPNGSLKINDIDINEYSRDAIFKSINYSTQKNVILDDSISNNINITKDDNLDVKKLSKLTDLYSDVMEMDNKFETKIGERGNRLSGGQKQRVQIARNLSTIREVNIYDDTLSALDSTTENKVLNSIIEETKKDILIVVSNKVSSMEKLDRIYMLIDGKIYATGTHAELLQKNSLYQEMYNYEKEGDSVWDK